MTAKYNGYFNANELLTMATSSYEKNHKDDFYSWLIIQPAPTTEESKGMYAAIDTAVVKCSKVIRNHSMPSLDRGTKDAEYNAWIDENWLTIGKAYYYRKDYEKALKNFQYVKRFFIKDPSRYLAELWIAKIYIEENRLTDAMNVLDQLQTIAIDQKKEKFIDRIFKKKEAASPDEEMNPPMPENIQFEIYKARADLYIRKSNADEALFPLTQAIKKCKSKREKARLNYILGQLYQSKNRIDSSLISFKSAITPSANYDVSFNAKLNCAVLGSSARDVRMLNKMLKDEKNASYKDQIYYAKGRLEEQNTNTVMAKVYYTKSAFFSTKNQRQKAQSYERLGDLSYMEKSYLNAQKYYDSCAKVMPENYPNGELIRSKATKLSTLVASMNIATYEDSVQRIAKMDEKAQTAFIKDVIKQLKEEAQRKKELEAAKMRALQDQANASASTGAGDKWVFNNPKLKQEGFDEFRKLWGDRKNEDDWRRSTKLANSIDTQEDQKTEDSLGIISTTDSNNDTLDIETMRSRLPLTDSLYIASVLREIEARYTAGSLYKDLLNEPELAIEQFDLVLLEETRNITDLSSAFQLYKLMESTPKTAVRYKKHIIENYPKSDAANYLQDPDFFEKVKENKAKAEQSYLLALKAYENGKYSEALSLTETVVNGDKANAYRAEYLYLNVLAFGQITSDKTLLIPKLKNIIEEKPGTPQAIQAKELLMLLEKGVSVFEPYKPKTNGIFVMNESVNQFVLILLDEKEEEDFDDLKATVSDFTSQNFKQVSLKLTTAMTKKEHNLLLVSDFKTISKAKEYINTYKASVDDLGDYQNNTIVIITQENLKKLIESDNFDEYKTFYDLNY
jgi:tetratricopeptide (TPR) repeat protein